MMEAAVVTPLRNSDTEEVTIYEDTVFEPEVCLEEDISVVKDNVSEKSQIKKKVCINKTPKIKRANLKTITGEKRKFPYISELGKTAKKVKQDDKSSENSPNSKEKTVNIVSISEASHSTPEVVRNIPPSAQSSEDCILVENDSDIENKSQMRPKPKQMSLRKSRAIANECRDAFDKLLTFDLETLAAMEKTLNSLKRYNLLSNKYISIDTLIQLILLALEAGKSECDRESVLLNIITKRTEELFVTPKANKTKQNVSADNLSLNQSVTKENAQLSISMLSEEHSEMQVSKNQSCDETIELEEVSTIEDCEEKTKEPAIEKSGKNFCITNYFKKLRKNVEERDKNERFSLFTTKTDMFLAPKLGGELTEEKRKIFEEEFSNQTHESDYLLKYSSKRKRNKSFKKTNDNKADSGVLSEAQTPDNVEGSSNTDTPSEIPKSESSGQKRVSLIKVDVPRSEPSEMVCRGKAKLLQFHDNRRPPYWGTWRKKSESVGPKTPFGKDKMFNYDVDSDEEWEEEEEEPGESLRGSDDEKEPEEDYEVDNDFFVPHGYLSDDENPEKENMSPKSKLNLLEEQFTLQLKEKTRKMTPLVFGSFWLYQGTESTGTLYQDLEIESLQYFSWTSGRVEIPEDDEIKLEGNLDQAEPTSQSKKLLQKTFPAEEIPNLIKIIHESPKNCGHLAMKFLLHWESENQNETRPRLTKVCVQKKIRELAAWQSSTESGKKCWYVPKTTREEFKTVEEKKSPEKRAQKCFIWKFVRKAEKGGTSAVSVATPTPTPTPAPDSQVVVLE